MAQLSITRDPSPEVYLAAQLNNALNPLQILGDNKMELARVANDRAYREQQEREAEDRRDRRVADERRYQDSRRDKMRKESKDDAAEERLRAMRVQAAAYGLSTAGKTEEQLASEISKAAFDQDLDRGSKKFAAERQRIAAETRRSLGLPETATDQEVDLARAKATGTSQAAAQAARLEAEAKAADEWINRPDSKPVIDRWIKLNREQDRLLAHNVNDIFQLPQVDKAKVGAALAASPEVLDLNLTPEQLAIVRSGQWEQLATNPKARMKPDLARRLLEAASEEITKQEQAGMLMAKLSQSAEARAAGPKLESIRRQLQAMQQSNPYLMRVPEPMDDEQTGEQTGSGGGDEEFPLPLPPAGVSPAGANPLLAPEASALAETAAAAPDPGLAPSETAVPMARPDASIWGAIPRRNQLLAPPPTFVSPSQPIPAGWPTEPQPTVTVPVSVWNALRGTSHLMPQDPVTVAPQPIPAGWPTEPQAVNPLSDGALQQFMPQVVSRTDPSIWSAIPKRPSFFTPTSSR